MTFWQRFEIQLDVFALGSASNRVYPEPEPLVSYFGCGDSEE
jgi:hypothetical protein